MRRLHGSEDLGCDFSLYHVVGWAVTDVSEKIVAFAFKRS
jgi:hypothetical protein